MKKKYSTPLVTIIHLAPPTLLAGSADDRFTIFSDTEEEEIETEEEFL
jgi:hypothetical protein